MSLDDDIRAAEAHRRQVELLQSMNPRVEKVRAKAEIKKARAESENYNIARGVGFVAAAVAAILLGISGCSAVVYGPSDDLTNQQKDQQKFEKYKLCVETHGKWDDGTEDCDR